MTGGRMKKLAKKGRLGGIGGMGMGKGFPF